MSDPSPFDVDLCARLCLVRAGGGEPEPRRPLVLVAALMVALVCWLRGRLKSAAHTLRVLRAIELCKIYSKLEHFETLCALLARGASDEYALLDSALFKAHAPNQSESIVDLLMRLLVRCRNSNRDRAVELLALASTLEPVIPQLMRSVDATAVHKQTGNTVMHSLACSDRVLEPWIKKLGARLMERGCNIDAVNRDGFTPILLAAKSGNASAF